MSNYYKHETAIIDANAVIGDRTKVWAFSHISSGAVVGRNCVIGEGVHIGPNVVIGDNCKIQNHSLVYEGVVLEDNVFFGPNTVTTNDYTPQVGGDWKSGDRFRTTIFKKGSSVGANTTIVCGVVVGENSLIGAGSVVTKSVSAGSVVFGNPARLKKEKL